jgi:hypothetical protein
VIPIWENASAEEEVAAGRMEGLNVLGIISEQHAK